MRSHPNAHLNQKGRLRLVTEHLEHGRSLKELAAENGISLRCASRWLARYRSGGPASLTDRRSVRRSQRRTLDPQQLQQAVDHRHQRCTLRRIAKALKAPLATVGRVMNALRLGRLRNLKPRKPVQLYQPELLSTGPAAKVRSGKGFAGAADPEGMVSPQGPVWIGKDFRLDRSPRAAASNSTSEGGSGGGSTARRPHWRRGNWHTVLHGEKRQSRRMQWFQPVYVGLNDR